VLTSPAFDFPARLPANVRYVGPVLDDPSGDPRWEPPWPEDNGRPLVIVSFSTSYQGHEAVLQKAVDALGQTDYRGLVTLGPALRSRRVDGPPNVCVRAFVPHSLVLPQAAAVVTHGGHGTAIRSLAYGVPLVCLPLGRDQPANAARVVSHKLGLRLNPEAEPAEIASAIRRVVESPEYREHARRMAGQLQDESRRPAAVDELEDVADSRGVSHEGEPDRGAPVSRRTRARNAALP
jgi:MGT family glycosyltransferase